MAASSPPATPAMSQDSTVFGIESTISLDNAKSLKQRAFQQAKPVTTARDILIFLVAFRIVNALSIKTFFQPDEYFQSLEPAWKIAFGANSGAWITWEWYSHLRSSIHPALFAIVYWIAEGTSWVLRLSPVRHAEFLIAAPKVLQAVCAALGDYYTWKLGEKIFGGGSSEAWAVLALTTLSPWQWFCSTRTLSNCLETTLTIVALNYWPWEWSLDPSEDAQEYQSSSQQLHNEDFVHGAEDSPRVNETSAADPAIEQKAEPHTTSTALTKKRPLQLSPLRVCLILASLACILRPTNILIWGCLSCYACIRTTSYGRFMETRWIDLPLWVHITTLEFLPSTRVEQKILITEGLICGSYVLAFSTLVDVLYYHQLTFPPLRFLYFNLAQSLAVFYGRNRADYYLTEGLPLLLTTYLPFGFIGICHGLSPPRNNPNFGTIYGFTQHVKHQMATTCLIVPLILSLISHKEVRFIYPLLPMLHLLAAAPFTTYFLPALSPAAKRHQLHTFKRLLLLLLLITNVVIALLSTTSHQTGPIKVLRYLRQQHAKYYLSQPPPYTLAPAPSTMTVGFLMPCHSTPWRSHLVFPSIKAWALGCEPPVNLNATERAAYVDEADRFYASPKAFLASTLGKPPLPRKKQAAAWWWPISLLSRNSNKDKRGFGREDMIEADAWDGQAGRKSWPEYLVFFGEKEKLLKEVARGSAYRECWRGWNSWGHDDWRRKGDVIVWCLRSQKEKRRRWGRDWW